MYLPGGKSKLNNLRHGASFSLDDMCYHLISITPLQCHYMIAMRSQAILRGYYSLLTLVRVHQNIVPQDSNTIMKYVIQDLFSTFSPFWSSSDQKTTTCKFTIFKISDYQRRVPSIPKKSFFNVPNLHNTFEFFKKNLQHIYWWYYRETPGSNQICLSSVR